MTTVYDTRTLLSVLEEVIEPDPFVLDRFFPYVQNFDTEFVDFDLIKGGRKLAPFVSPSVAGKPQTHRGVVTKTFKPAYVKPKNVVDPNRPFKRRAGERYAGTMTPAERRDATIADILLEHSRQVKRRKIWMAWQALRTGKVIVKGEDFPEQVVDFGRDAALTKVLAGAARWGEAGVSPVVDLEAWALEVSKKSLGANPNTVVMGNEAWKLYSADPKLEKLLDLRRGSESNAELGAQPELGYVKKATVGNLEIWLATDAYEDDDGTVQDMVGEYDVVLGSPLVEGVQAHGAIRDPKAGYQALELFPKNWINEDPAEEYVMTQSAPLVVPVRVNATGCATVR